MVQEKETTTEQTTKNEKKASSSQKETTTKKESLVDCDIENYTVEGKVTRSERNSLAKSLNKLPSNIINKFNDEGWELCLTTKDIAKNYYVGSVKGSIAGVTVYNKKIIYVSVDVSYPSTKYTAYHEMGHFLDWCNNYSSSTDEFEQIYNSEKSSLAISGRSNRQKNHARSDTTEYYAESFSAYMFGCLKDECPDTYEYITNDLHNI